MRVLVTGASGHVGRRTAELVADAAGAAGESVTLRLLARDLGRAPSLPGAETVEADYGDPSSVRDAFEGVDRAFVVSAGGAPGRRAELHAEVFGAAARAGVERIVYLSTAGASPDAVFAMARDHHASEAALRTAGPSSVVLRDTLYLDLVPGLIGPDAVLRAPAGEGRAAFAAREDVAAVAAAVLLHDDPAAEYLVTGPEALSLRDVAQRVAELTGVDVRYDDETPDEARVRRRAAGVPEWKVEAFVGAYLAMREGAYEATSTDVERLTGRVPVDLEAFVRRERDAFSHFRPATAG